MVSQNSSCGAFYLSTCSLVAWVIYEPVFEFLCGCRGDRDGYWKLWRYSMRENGVGGSGGIGVFTWYLLDGGDVDLVGCCDKCVGGVGGGDDNDGVGFDDESVGNLVLTFIMDMDFFGWLVVGARGSVVKESVGWSYGEDLVGWNRVKRRVAVFAIAVREALSVLPKAPSPLEVNRFYLVVWRVSVEIFLEACSIQWRLYVTESLVDIV